MTWPSEILTAQPYSLDIYGAWRWIATDASFLPERATPAACACDRLLYLNRDGKYAFVEQDSAHEYVLCQGSFTMSSSPDRKESAQGRRSLGFRLEFEGWPRAFERVQSATLVGSDSLITSAFAMEGAPVHAFVRVAKSSVGDSTAVQKARLPLHRRPPRAGDMGTGRGDFVYYEEEPVPLKTVKPTYPEFARKTGVQGVVVIHVLVGTEGYVMDLRVVRGIADLNDAAVEAARRWVFKPALTRKNPVAVWFEVPVRFPP